MKSSFKKTALATVVAGTFAAAAAVPVAEANVLNVSWSGAFTMLNPAGAALTNAPSDYQGNSFYANGFYGNGAASFGTPKYPANAVNGTPLGSTYYPGAVSTTHGWKGKRTPVSGTMSFDTTTGAGVGTVNDFFFFGDTPGSGSGTAVARALGITFASIDTVGTLVGTMLFSWNGGGHSVSIVLDASGMFGALGTTGLPPTSVISGVGSLAATDGYNWGSSKAPITFPFGPSPVVTKTLNTGAGCDGVPISTQVNAYTINPIPSVVGACMTGMVDDSIGGDPMSSAAFGAHNANFDITSIHIDSFVPTPGPAVPVPAAVWLFGSGLLGLVGIARRKKKA